MKAKRTTLSPDRVATYRDYEPDTLDGQIRQLTGMVLHRRGFAAAGATALVAATERAWVQDAIITAATPARDAAEAQRKVDYLQCQLDGWVMTTDQASEHAVAVSAIGAALLAECQRWNIIVAGGERPH